MICRRTIRQSAKTIGVMSTQQTTTNRENTVEVFVTNPRTTSPQKTINQVIPI
jgi:hypothetical protein